VGGWGACDAPGGLRCPAFVTRRAAGAGCRFSIGGQPPRSVFVTAWVVIQMRGHRSSRRQLVCAQLWPLSLFSGQRRRWGGVRHYMGAVGVVWVLLRGTYATISCVKGNWGGQRHRTERLAPYLVALCLSSSPSALAVLVVLVPHCCLCRFPGLLLGLHLLLWAGLCLHKGEVGGIVRGVAGVSGEREGDGGGRKERV